MKKKEKMLFVIRKYVWAIDVASALRMDKKCPPHDCWVDDDFKRSMRETKDAIGFNIERKQENEDD